MAVKAVRQSKPQDHLPREEWERLVRPTNQEVIPQQLRSAFHDPL